MASIRVVFFAHLRESVGLPELTIDLSVLTSQDTNALVTYLTKTNTKFKDYRDSSAVLVAVNQTLINNNTAIDNGDIVALFPPVTGG